MRSLESLRVLIDGYWWEDGPPSARLLVREVVREWMHRYPSDNVYVAVPRRHCASVESELGSVEVVPTRLRMHPLINFVELPLRARRLGAVDAVVAFNFAAWRRASVLFLLDVLFQSNPEWFTRIERTYLSPIPLLARIPASTVTLSESERRRIRAHNPRINRIAVSGLAVAGSLRAASPSPLQLGLMSGEFVVAVGRINVRKNLQRTIDGALRSGRISNRFPLVIVGESAANELTGDAIAGTADGAVVFTGRVTDDELRWLYENCAFLCFLSLGEGFGLPPLEAMAFGAPVLVSDLEVFHETLGEDATFVDPCDTAAISSAMADMALRGTGPSPRMRRPELFDWSGVVDVLRREVCDMAAK